VEAPECSRDVRMKQGKKVRLRKNRRSTQKPSQKATQDAKQKWQFSDSGRAKDRIPVQWETFESTMGFSIQDHINGYFSKVDIKEARKHKRQLEAKQEETAQQLQAFVTEHYKQFINISNEIMNIEGDMAKLTTMLGSYRGLMKSLQRTTFDFSSFSDEVKRDEEEPNAPGQPGLFLDLQTTSSSRRIEALCEEVGVMVYQSKYGLAVDRIQEARTILDKIVQNPALLEQDVRYTHSYKGAEGKEDTQNVSKEMKKRIRVLKAGVDRQVRALVSALKTELRRAQEGFVWDAGDLGGVRIIRYLLRLGRSDEALEILLRTRSRGLRAEVRGIKFQGDAAQYMESLSQVVFRGISHCIEEFSVIFPEGKGNSMMSAVIQWVIEELEDYVERFSTQVSEARSNFVQLGQCLRSAFRACATLDNRGLNLAFVLARRLHPIVQEAIVRAMRGVVNQIVKPGGELSKETWLSRKLIVKELDGDSGAKGRASPDWGAGGGKGGGSGNGNANANGGGRPGAAARGGDPSPRKRPGKKEIRLTGSAIYLYNAVRTLLEADLILIVDEAVLPYGAVALYGTVANGVIGLLHEVVTHQAKMASKGLPKEREAQHLSIVANFQFLLADLLPRIERSLAALFNRTAAAEVKLFEGRLGEICKALLRSFCKRRVEIWVELLEWNPKALNRYYGPEGDTPGRVTDESFDVKRPDVNLQVSERFVKLLEVMHRLMDNIATHLKRAATKHILGESLDMFFRTLASSDRISKLTTSMHGMQRLHLDLRFMISVSEGFLSDNGVRYAQSLLQTVIGLHSKTHQVESASLYPEEFFDEKIKEQLEVTAPLSKYVATGKAKSRS